MHVCVCDVCVMCVCVCVFTCTCTVPACMHTMHKLSIIGAIISADHNKKEPSIPHNIAEEEHKLKPLMIVDYNEFMLGVDKLDQMMS